MKYRMQNIGGAFDGHVYVRMRGSQNVTISANLSSSLANGHQYKGVEIDESDTFDDAKYKLSRVISAAIALELRKADKAIGEAIDAIASAYLKKEGE